jgi:hypothetical protein
MGKLYVNMRLNVALLTCMKTINSVAGILTKGGNKQIGPDEGGSRIKQGLYKIRSQVKLTSASHSNKLNTIKHHKSSH